MAKKTTYNYPPGPRALPILGNVFNMDINAMHHSLWAHKDVYGDISSFVLSGQRFVALHSYDVIQEALGEEGTVRICSDRANNFFNRYVIGDGIAMVPHSDTWKALSQTTRNSIKQSTCPHNVSNVTQALRQQVLDELKAYHSQDKESVDLSESIQHFVGNWLAIAIVGKRFERDHDFHKYLHQYVTHSKILMAPKNLGVMTKFPSLRKIPYGLGLSFLSVQTTKDKLVQLLFHEPKKYNEIKTGIVSDLLQAQKSNSDITDDRIECVIQDVFTAGFIALNMSIRCLMHQLVQCVDVQKKVCEEIDKVIGKERSVSDFGLKDLPNVHAAILESMRFTSVVPGSVPRMNSKDLTLGKYTIEKGTVLVPNLWRIHHEQDVFEDPWSFRHTRYLGDNGQVIPTNDPKRQQLLPFGLGVRTCTGEALAWSAIFNYVTTVFQTCALIPTKEEETLDPRCYGRDVLITHPPFTVNIRPRKC